MRFQRKCITCRVDLKRYSFLEFDYVTGVSIFGKYKIYFFKSYLKIQFFNKLHCQIRFIYLAVHIKNFLKLAIKKT